MRVIEHGRRTMPAKPGDHLSQAGVELARRGLLAPLVAIVTRVPGLVARPARLALRSPRQGMLGRRRSVLR